MTTAEKQDLFFAAGMLFACLLMLGACDTTGPNTYNAANSHCPHGNAAFATQTMLGQDAKAYVVRRATSTPCFYEVIEVPTATTQPPPVKPSAGHRHG